MTLSSLAGLSGPKTKTGSAYALADSSSLWPLRAKSRGFERQPYLRLDSHHTARASAAEAQALAERGGPRACHTKRNKRRFSRRATRAARALARRGRPYADCRPARRTQ